MWEIKNDEYKTEEGKSKIYLSFRNFGNGKFWRWIWIQQRKKPIK